MLPAGTSAASWQRIFLALAVGTLGVGCSSAGGSGTSEPTDTSDSAAPVLRTANGQQIFGPGNADPSSDGSAAGRGAGSSPVGSTPSASDEAQKTPVLLAPDAGAGDGDFLRLVEGDELLAIGVYLAAEKIVQPRLVLV